MQTPKLVAGPFNHLRQCRHGYMLYNCHDMYVGKSLDLYGEYSEGEMALLRQVLHPGDLCLDVGANLGTHTVFLANTVGPEGKVFAFEPQRLVFQTLCANIALNSITNTHCINAAVGAERGVIHVPLLNSSATNNFGGLGLDPSGKGEPVPVITVDSLSLPSCRLLKADVEGMEIQVLKGAVETIGRHKPFLYVENDRIPNSHALMAFIDSLGYHMYWHFPTLFNANNYFGNSENVFGRILSVNLFCTHSSVNVTLQGFRRAYAGEKHPLEN